MPPRPKNRQWPDGKLIPERNIRAPRQNQFKRFSKITESLPTPSYSTRYGKAYCGDSKDLILAIPSGSIDAIITSPPFALLRKKQYGNESAQDYIEWFLDFAKQFKRVLRPTGSLVIELGGSWQRGKPIRSLYQYELLLKLADIFCFAQDFYFYNTAKLPTPVEWVSVRRCRLKDAVTPVWWFSKKPNPKADNRRVLYPYGQHMQRLLENGYNDGPRPSEHVISKKWGTDNGGSISPNIIAAANTSSSDNYLRRCREFGFKPHPARFHPALPTFFTRLLTTPGNIVLDPFAGSNVTGRVAEDNNRFWISFESGVSYVKTSALRFFSNLEDLKNP